jgi:hypothetical protein
MITVETVVWQNLFFIAHGLNRGLMREFIMGELDIKIGNGQKGINKII